MPRTRNVVIASAAAGALALGVGIAGYAAADPTSSPSASPSAPADRDRWPGPGGHRGGGGWHRMSDDLAEQLAEKLGVSEAKVSEALRAVRERHRDDRPTARPSASPGALPTRPDPSERKAELAAGLAEELGVSEAKVTKALDEIQAERRADRAAALKTRLDEAVKAGTLTQAEADAVAKAVEKGVIGGR